MMNVFGSDEEEFQLLLKVNNIENETSGVFPISFTFIVSLSYKRRLVIFSDLD